MNRTSALWRENTGKSYNEMNFAVCDILPCHPKVLVFIRGKKIIVELSYNWISIQNTRSDFYVCIILST